MNKINDNYYNKYLKYKQKYLNLSDQQSLNKYMAGGSNEINDILYENIVGKINPRDNEITQTSLSDHYLLHKEITLSSMEKVNLFSINITQQYQFKTKIKIGIFINTMRNEYNLNFVKENRENIINIILNISKANRDLLKNKNKEMITNFFKQEFEKISTISIDNLNINFVTIKESEAKKHIFDNLEIDPETELFYTFDISFNKEEFYSYKNRVKEILLILTNTIENKNLFNPSNFIIINIQELSPFDKILDTFEKYISKIKTNYLFDFKLIYNSNDILNSEYTYSLTIISSNIEKNINYQLNNNSDTIMDFIIEQKNNPVIKNIKISSNNDFWPTIYNFHTNLLSYDYFISFIHYIKSDNFIIFGDLNLKLLNSEQINNVKQIAKQNNIIIELTATPESNYPINNYTYDVLMYKLMF
jgi:hypothetical protein